MPTPNQPARRLPLMSHAERSMWLASHKSPDGYMLVHQSETENMLAALVANKGLLEAHRKGLNMLLEQARPYMAAEPDLTNAVGAAVFDAQRYKKGCDLALVKLQQLLAKLEKIAVAPGLLPVTVIDVTNVALDTESMIDLLEKQRYQRRTRLAAFDPEILTRGIVPIKT
jgi:hypothetical protein